MDSKRYDIFNFLKFWNGKFFGYGFNLLFVRCNEYIFDGDFIVFIVFIIGSGFMG